MEFNENTKLTDSLERTLIEREANAMRGAAFAAMGGTFVAKLHRFGRGAVGALASLRNSAKAAKVDYAAG